MQARLDELAPLLVEHDQLTRAIAHLDASASVDAAAPEPATPERKQRKRPAPPGSVLDAALAVVRDDPGLQARQVGERIGVDRDNAAAALHRLRRKGLIESRDLG